MGMNKNLLADHPYASFLHLVERPARYVGGEYKSVHKDRARVRMCLAFPDVYDIGMSHLGTKILYSLINRQPDLALERVYAPWFDMESELRKRSLPLVSLESAKALCEFDVVGFSLQYEMTFTNVLTMLDLGGIPLRSDSRTGKDPLVIAGGPNTTHPEAVSPFFDAFLVGDAEESLPGLLSLVGGLKEGGASRRDLLVKLSELDGVYVPSLYSTVLDPLSGFLVIDKPLAEETPDRVTRLRVDSLDKHPFPSDSPVPVAEAIFDRVSIEIARGCTEGCRFCQAGMVYRPARERAPEEIVSAILASLETGGYDEVSLTSLSTADYSCVSPLIRRVMDELRPRRVSLSVSSLRAYGLDQDLLDQMSSVRATGLTFAPEAGTQRLRDVINKNISEEDFLSTCERVFERGWKRVKLYFMIGLPTETDEDIAEIATLAKKALDIGRSHKRGADVTVSVSSHVPKPNTPFQWCAMDGLEEIARKQRLLFARSKALGLKFRKHDARISHLEGILARCDRRGADLVERAWRNGARFDGWDEHLNWQAWEDALEEWETETGVRREQFLEETTPGGRLPWDHIDVGVDPDFLIREHKRALDGRVSPPCGKPAGSMTHHTNLEDLDADDRRLVCYHCGLECDLDELRRKRHESLRSLGAKSRVTTTEAVTERERAHERYRRGLTPRDFDQGANLPVRIQYTKLGSVALQGHLDMVRLLPRIFRRARVELAYSLGFHPKPIAQYGPALALGLQSTSELADVRLRHLIPEEELLQRLNEVAPKGLQIVSAHYLEPGQKKLSKVLRVQDYLLSVSAGSLETDETLLTPIVALSAKCEAFLALESTPHTRIRSGKNVEIDCRAGILALDPLDEKAWPDGLVLRHRIGVRARVLLNMSGPTPKPSELGRSIFGVELAPIDMARIGLWGLDEEGAIVSLVGAAS